MQQNFQDFDKTIQKNKQLNIRSNRIFNINSFTSNFS